MAFIDDLRQAFGVQAPVTTQVSPEDFLPQPTQGSFIEAIGAALQGGTGVPQPQVGGGLDQLVSGLSPEQDFLRGLFQGAEIEGFRESLLGDVRGPQEIVEPSVPARPEGTGTFLDQLQEGLGEFAPLVLGSAGAGLAAAAPRVVGATLPAVEDTSVAAGPILGNLPFFLSENIATGIVADAALNKSIPEGIAFSAAGSLGFGLMGAALRATGRAPRFVLEQVSDVQKNIKLRQMAKAGVDPRATDAINQVGEAFRAVDEILGTDTADSVINSVYKADPDIADILSTTTDPFEKAALIEGLLDDAGKFVDNILDQKNLTDVVETRKAADVAAKTTGSGGIKDVVQLDTALKQLGLEDFDILDRVAPTATLDERLRVLNGDVDTFVGVSRRMGTPERELEKVLEFMNKNPGDVPRRMLVSLQEQAQIGQLQGRLDTVNPNFHGQDPAVKQFLALPEEQKQDMMQVLRALGLSDSDETFPKALMEFQKRVDRFVEGTRFDPTLPELPVSEGDVLRGVVRAAPSRAAATRAMTPGKAVGNFIEPDSGGFLSVRGGLAAVRNLNSIPLPLSEAAVTQTRQVLDDIISLKMFEAPHLAISAIRARKQLDKAVPLLRRTVTTMGRELSQLGGPFSDFVMRRFRLEGPTVLTRLGLSTALKGTSFHTPELTPAFVKEFLGVTLPERPTGVQIQAQDVGTFRRLATTQAKADASFEATGLHEFGHELHTQLKNSEILEDNQVAAVFETIAEGIQPYRNDDPMFRSMTGAKMGPNNQWVEHHAGNREGNILEGVAELIGLLSTPEGRRHIVPEARELLETIGITIKEPYAPNRPPFQRGLEAPIGMRRGQFVPGEPEAPPNAQTLLKNIGAAIREAFPAKEPSTRVAGNTAVGPRGLAGQRTEAMQNAMAALATVRRADTGDEVQLSLFGSAGREFPLRLLRAPKATETALKSQLDKLGSNAVQAFNESLITLPRSSQAKFVNDFISRGDEVLKPEFRDFTRALREIRASAMLFGPSTWFANIFSTLLNTGIRPLTAFAAAGIDFTRSAVTGAERTRFASDAIAEIAGLLQGAREATWWRAQQLRARGAGAIPQTALQELFETGSVLRQGGFREAVFQGSDTAFFGSKLPGGAGPSAKIGTGVQLPFKILRDSDNWLYDMNFTAEMYRQAANELRRTGQQYNLKNVRRLVEGKAVQSAKLRKAAAEFAESELQKNFGEGFTKADGSLPVPLKALQDDMIQKALLDELPTDLIQAQEIAKRTIFVAREGKRLDQFLDKVDALDDVLGGALSLPAPFRRTPANIVREGIRTSPLGFIAPTVDVLGPMMGRPNPRTAEELIDAYAQASVGTALYGALAGLALYGVIEGNPEHFERNRAKRTTYFADGRLPETVFIGLDSGRRLSVPLSRLQPVGGLILGALRAAETIRDQRFATLRPDVLAGTQFEIVKALGVQDQVEGMSDFLEALVSDDPQLNFAERFGGSFVPAFIRQSRQAAGIPQGRADRVSESNAISRFLQGASSGAFNSGLPKLGLFGEPLQRTPVAGSFGAATVGRDPVVSAMIDAGSFHQAPDLLPELREADAGIKHAFVRGKGRLQRQFVTRVVNRRGFAEMPQERRKRLIDAAYTRASLLANQRGKNALRNGATITPQLIVGGKLGL